MSLFLWEHWGRIFEIFWVVLKSLGLTIDFKLLTLRARLKCAHQSCVSSAGSMELGTICFGDVDTLVSLPAGKAQIKGIISHPRVICLVECPQLEFCLHILLPSMDGTEEVLQ